MPSVGVCERNPAGAPNTIKHSNAVQRVAVRAASDRDGTLEDERNKKKVERTDKRRERGASPNRSRKGVLVCVFTTSRIVESQIRSGRERVGDPRGHG